VDVHALIHVLVLVHKTVSMHQTEYAGIIGNLELTQKDANNRAFGNNNNRKTQQPIVKRGKRLWP